MRLTGAQIICEALQREGVEVIFGVPGGAVLPLYDTLHQYPQLHHVLVRHEQGAAHAADGYARATGKVGVCFATSGPGATNLVTGLANAIMDSVPLVAITGQVATPVIGKDAFQETDITGITLPITKHNYLVLTVEDVAPVLKEAFHLARTGRSGPVLVDIPRDVQQASTEFHYPDAVNIPGYRPTLTGHPTQIRKAVKLINEAQRPLIIAGHGILLSGAEAELKELAEKAQIPVITTLLGVGCFPQTHLLSYGMVGMHGMAYANLATMACDVLIAVGMRMDDRVTGKTSAFAAQAQIIHIDIDPAEIGKNIRAHVPIVGDAKNVLRDLNKHVTKATHPEWIAQMEEWRQEHPSHTIRDTDQLIPQYVVRQIYEATEGKAIVVTGVGQHQMWVAQHFLFDRPHTLISSGGLGTMGFGLPAAIGAQMGRPRELVWLIDGDGSFQMTMQELATVIQENLPLKIAIINNQYLGMVRQWQQFFYKKNYAASHVPGPDYVKLAEAFGIPGLRVTDKLQVTASVQQALDHAGPFLIDFQVEPEENCYPMIPSGMTVADMIEETREEVAAWRRTSIRS